MMTRKPIRRLWAAIPLALVLMLALPLSAFASATITGVYLNGELPPVTVAPGESIEMTVYAHGYESTDQWHATGWRIGSGDWNCVDTPDQDGVGDKSVAFTINAPTTPGTYDLNVAIYQSYDSGGCQDPASGTLVSPAIVVSSAGTSCPVFQSAGENANSSSSYATILLPKPSGTTAGDLLIAVITLNGGIDNDVETPVGWNPILTTNNSTNVRIETFWRAVDASDEWAITNYVFNLSGPFTRRASGGILLYRGGPTTSPIDTSTGDSGYYYCHTSGCYDAAHAPSITTLAGTNEPVIAAFGLDTGDDNVDPSPGWDERVDVRNDDSSGPTTEVADHVFTTTGPTADRYPSSYPENTYWVAQQIALKCGTAPSGPTKLAFTTSPFTGAWGDCLGPITVQTQNASDAATNVTSDTTVNLTTDATGWFYSDAACSTGITSKLIATGNNSASFYYKAGAIGDGTHLLMASDSAGVLYGASQTQNITKKPGSVSINNIPASAVYGGSFTPTFDKLGDGTPSAASLTADKCTVDAGTGLVSFVGVGTCTLQASVTAGTDYFAATGAQQSFTINKAPGSVSINNIPAAHAAVYGGSFTPTFDQLGDGTPSVASLTTTKCTVSAGVVSFVGAGTCTLQASITEGTYYLAATGAQQSFTIDKAVLTITAHDLNKTYGDVCHFDTTYPGDFDVEGLVGSDQITWISMASAGCDKWATVAGSPYDIIPSNAHGTGLSNYDKVYEFGELTVTARDALVRYIGETYFVTSGASSTVAQVHLTASMQDPSGEELVGATITFWDDTNNTSLAADVPVSPVPGEIHTGTADVIVTLSSGQYGGETYAIRVAATGDYANEAQLEDPDHVGEATATLVVTKPPLSGEATGGGVYASILVASPAGTYGDKSLGAGFSVGMKYNKSGKNPQGKIVLIVQELDGSRVYIRSNSISSFKISGTDPKTVVIYTKASIYRIRCDGSQESIDGNVTMRTDITDASIRKGGDKIGFTVLSSKGSLLYYSNNWKNPDGLGWKTVAQSFLGGVMVN